MSEFNEITDIHTYNALMNRAIMDKLFFVDKIDANTVVDYGSANGCLIKNLVSWLPNVNFIGYDNNQEMNELAQANCKDFANVKFFDDWSKVKQNCAGKTAVVLSSVIHEVYHYSEIKEIDNFWNRIFQFDYIIIRDMIPSRSVNRSSDINDVAKIYRKFLKTSELEDFENNYGSIENNRNLVHFLLKYKYVQPNWSREVKENYFPFYREELLAKIPNEYEIIYHEHYVLPYLKNQIMKDFRIDLKDATHLKMILQRI